MLQLKDIIELTKRLLYLPREDNPLLTSGGGGSREGHWVWMNPLWTSIHKNYLCCTLLTALLCTEPGSIQPSNNCPCTPIRFLQVSTGSPAGLHSWLFWLVILVGAHLCAWTLRDLPQLQPPPPPPPCNFLDPLLLIIAIFTQVMD